MAKKNETYMQSSRSHWLKLSLEQMDILLELDSVNNALIPKVAEARKDN